MSFLEPSPVLVAFLFVKSFVYLELLAVLALIRVLVANSTSRAAAAGALILSLAGLAVILAPAFGVNHGPVYVAAYKVMQAGQGLYALLAPSVLMALSAYMTGVRWRWIDVVHILLLWSLIGLWLAARVA